MASRGVLRAAALTALLLGCGSGAGGGSGGTAGGAGAAGGARRGWRQRQQWRRGQRRRARGQRRCERRQQRWRERGRRWRRRQWRRRDVGRERRRSRRRWWRIRLRRLRPWRSGRRIDRNGRTWRRWRIGHGGRDGRNLWPRRHGGPAERPDDAGPVGTISGALATGVAFLDTDGERVNAHGGGIIQVGDTFYMHGEYFLSTTTDNNFNGFSMYSSKDLATWKNEGIILPQQPSGELGPNRKGERPHIIQCPSTGEFVLYAHAASEDYQTDKEVVYATSATVNGQYAYKGPLKNASGSIAAHSDMSAYADDTGAYVLTESGHVYTLATDCHSWLSDKSYSARSTATRAARNRRRCSRPAAPTTGSARTRPAGAPTTTSTRPRRR